MVDQGLLQGLNRIGDRGRTRVGKSATTWKLWERSDADGGFSESDLWM